jgi:hypothetical protein
MPVIETSIAEGYVMTWTAMDALRELISNAIDADKRSGHAYFVKHKTNVLTVRSEGAKVNTSALLMGFSESRSHVSTIGEFGEGLPLALKTLAMLGYDVEIDNDDERWTPVIQRSDTYNARVLCIKTRKIKSRGHFEVRVHGIDESAYTKTKELFLELSDRDSSQEVLGDAGTCILMSPEFKGKVYNKGVFVTFNEDLMWGYNLHTRLNRDRNIIDTYEMRESITNLICSVLLTNPNNFARKLAKELLESPKALEAESGYSAVVSDEDLQNELFSAWEDLHGDKIPVEDNDSAKIVTGLGRECVITSSTVAAVLGKVPKYDANAIADELQRKPTKVYKLRSLEDHEYKHLVHAIKALKSAKTRPDMKVKIVDFPRGTWTSTVWDEDTHTILVGKTSLDVQSNAITALAAGLCLSQGLSRAPRNINYILVKALEA